jgi:hypothetical protein
MTNETLDQIIAALQRENMTPQELLAYCQETYGMDTLAFTEGIAQLEHVGLVSRWNSVNKDNSGSIVYGLDEVRTESQKY